MKYIIDIHDTGLNITPYTEPDQKVIEDAQGEAWELARKIVNMRYEEFSKCFDVTDDYWEVNIMDIMSYSEAKAKYDEWKNQKEEFRVGEEVYDHAISGTGIVKNIENKNIVDILWNDGSISESINIRDLEKTGRTFPEIIEFFNG